MRGMAADVILIDVALGIDDHAAGNAFCFRAGSAWFGLANMKPCIPSLGEGPKPASTEHSSSIRVLEHAGFLSHFHGRHTRREGNPPRERSALSLPVGACGQGMWDPGVKVPGEGSNLGGLLKLKSPASCT